MFFHLKRPEGGRDREREREREREKEEERYSEKRRKSEKESEHICTQGAENNVELKTNCMIYLERHR